MVGTDCVWRFDILFPFIFVWFGLVCVVDCVVFYFKISLVVSLGLLLSFWFWFFVLSRCSCDALIFFASLKQLFSFFHAPFIASTYEHVHKRAHIR